jgi:beta-galactosidase
MMRGMNEAPLAAGVPAHRDTAVQRRWRRLRPWPVGCVLIQAPGEGPDELRVHVRRMRELGFTCLKQICLVPGADLAACMHMAVDEGVSPWWFDDAADDEPVPELLARLGIPAGLVGDELRRHPLWQAHIRAARHALVDLPRLPGVKKACEAGQVPGMVEPWEAGLKPEAGPAFAAWLRARHGSVAALRAAWNCGHTGIHDPGWTDWDQVAAGCVAAVSNGLPREYRRLIDLLRFKVEVRMAAHRADCDAVADPDRRRPQRAGGEMSVFLPAAQWGVDFAAIADVMAEHGSFYISLHPSWHFEEAGFELLRPAFIQAAYAADLARGVWTGLWESVGGPIALSGGKADFHEPARRQWPGVALDAGGITQLMLGWIAAGVRGTGAWCWTPRTAGWEAGEFALCGRDGLPGERARAYGAVGAAANALRDELWCADKQPLVGVLAEWEQDAMWAAAAVAGRDWYCEVPTRARLGAARALLDGNVPWEFCTAAQLRAGGLARYRVLYLPAALGLDAGLLPLLADWVRGGGRVVLDAPGGWYDLAGRLLDTRPGSAFHDLFGCTITDVHFARRTDRPWELAAGRLEGFAIDCRPDPAVVRSRFAHGVPAVLENRLGAGSAVVLAWDAALQCAAPGRGAWQTLLLDGLLGGLRPDLVCPGCLALRLHTPTAVHVFLLNEGPARRVGVQLAGAAGAGRDVLDGAAVDLAAVDLPAWSGRWIRVARSA